MNDLNKSNYRSSSSESRYLAAIRKAEQSKSPVLNRDLWDHFSDYSQTKLVNNCLALASHLLEKKEISLIGIDVEKDCSYEPQFVVLLPNEYRNDDEILNELPKTWAGRLSVVYRIK